MHSHTARAGNFAGCFVTMKCISHSDPAKKACPSGLLDPGTPMKPKGFQLLGFLDNSHLSQKKPCPISFWKISSGFLAVRARIGTLLHSCAWGINPQDPNKKLHTEWLRKSKANLMRSPDFLSSTPPLQRASTRPCRTLRPRSSAPTARPRGRQWPASRTSAGRPGRSVGHRGIRIQRPRSNC